MCQGFCFISLNTLTGRRCWTICDWSSNGKLFQWHTRTFIKSQTCFGPGGFLTVFLCHCCFSVQFNWVQVQTLHSFSGKFSVIRWSSCRTMTMLTSNSKMGAESKHEDQREIVCVGKNWIVTDRLWSWWSPVWGRWRAEGTPCRWEWRGHGRRRPQRSGCSGFLSRLWRSLQHNLQQQAGGASEKQLLWRKTTPAPNVGAYHRSLLAPAAAQYSWWADLSSPPPARQSSAGWSRSWWRPNVLWWGILEGHSSADQETLFLQ